MFATLLALTASAPDVFVAPAAADGTEGGERMFGGQLLAQCLVAAQTTVDGERAANSLHGYFLRPGAGGKPLRVVVQRLRDGRSFSHRQAIAEQDGKERFRLIASFQAPEDTPRYDAAPMPAAPAPEQVAHTYDDFTLAQSGADAWHGSARPVDIRYVNPPPRGREPVTETQLMWMRMREPLGDCAAVHQAALAYLSDTTLVDHTPLPLGRRWQDLGFDGASLDHAMWFHRPARADEWLLFAQDVEATGGGRGLARGRLYARQGELVATCLQEGLMRWITPTTTPAT